MHDAGLSGEARIGGKKDEQEMLDWSAPFCLCLI
jgi:hypothetical protein